MTEAKAAQQKQQEVVSHCGCKKTPWSQWFCKHCKKSWEEVASDESADFVAADNDSPPGLAPRAAGLQPPPGIKSKELELSNEEVDNLVVLASKIGDQAMEDKYKAIREYKKRLAMEPRTVPLQLQAQQAHQRVLQLEGRLKQEVAKFEHMQAALQEQTQLVETLSSDLEVADGQYKELLGHLHTNVGDLSCFDLGECETLYGLVDPKPHEVTEEDQKQAAERKEKMQRGIAELAQTLFGSAKSLAENITKEHEEHVKRLSTKKRAEAAPPQAEPRAPRREAHSLRLAPRLTPCQRLLVVLLMASSGRATC
ncbi:unnamed protein product [Prorocentrum cordatum]|uniref:Uncharacterized protein n=1 Tax=Prorocentrum cordatum TaxID=2364126 RepID=A0ABN9PQW1_9DINO|nr:unnamed protein product [Polarella glacialis]